MKVRSGLLLIAIFVTVSALAQQSNQPKYQQNPPSSQTQPVVKGSSQKGSTPAQSSGKYGYTPQLSGAERDTMRTCMSGTNGNTGVSVRPLPASLDSQVQVGSQLSSALQKRLQPLPSLCSSKLTMTLPQGWSRALLGTHVVLLDPNQKIVDMFDLN